MNISVREFAKVCRIGVLGRVLEDTDQEHLLQTIEKYLPGKEVLIEVYDADTLPNRVIVYLSKVWQTDAPLKLLAYRGLLTHSMMRLGLPVQQVVSQRLGSDTSACRALVLAGSANSLDKILEIITHLPPSKLAIFVVQHIRDDQPNRLDQLLRQRCACRVIAPADKTPVEDGVIYVAPPALHMTVRGGQICLTSHARVHYARPSIDVLMESVALEYGPQACGVLLCGLGRDGVAGCAALKNAGAPVIIEDAQECGDARALPEAARDAGHYHYVLRVGAIASIVHSLSCQAALNESSLKAFLQALWSQYGQDLRNYELGSLQRRVNNLMVRFQSRDFLDFQIQVLTDYQAFERFLAELTVGVTEFFRHPEQFEILREQVLPVLATFPVIRVWSAGCSSGEEPYSLAILLDELGLLKKSRLFATDVNPYLLELGRSGLYPMSALQQARDNHARTGGSARVDASFTPGPSWVAVAEHIQNAVLFHQHSLATNSTFNQFQLIVCRNAMIYFDATLQGKILQLFWQSLHPEGYLVLGPRDGLDPIARHHGFVPHGSGRSVFRRSNEVPHG